MSSSSSPWSIALDRFVSNFWINKAMLYGDDQRRLLRDSPLLFQNEAKDQLEVGPTRLLFQSSFAEGAFGPSIGVAAYCNVEQRYVESRIKCTRAHFSEQQICSVIAQRISKKEMNPPKEITTLSFPLIWSGVTENMPSTLGKGLSRADLVLHYLNNPGIAKPNLITVSDMFTDINEQLFSHRLPQIFNTYMLLSQLFTIAPVGSVDPAVSLIPNVTLPVQVSNLVQRYHIPRVWFVLCFVSFLMLLIVGVMSTVFAYLGPEILGYASMLVRDSKFIHLPEQAREMDGIDVTKLIAHRRVRYGVTHMGSNDQEMPLIGVGLEGQTERIKNR
ncbi:hypothetical protein VTL71DRAFT_8111 [Oculimacula yallundae]|uniref:Uncharacterized protein n=1 Tax=Oculimacula yallundae TaxID=86028 RepID=A0ABR4CY67_9HELO